MDVARIASFVQMKDYIRSMDETLIPQNPKPLMQNPWFCCRVGVRGLLLLLHPKLSCESSALLSLPVLRREGRARTAALAHAV